MVIFQFCAFPYFLPSFSSFFDSLSISFMATFIGGLMMVDVEGHVVVEEDQALEVKHQMSMFEVKPLDEVIDG